MRTPRKTSAVRSAPSPALKYRRSLARSTGDLSASSLARNAWAVACVAMGEAA
jgi:hypothetical protein